MPRTEALKQAQAKYKKKRVQIVLDMLPEQREQINDYCKQYGGTATHIKRLLYADMRSNGVIPLADEQE